MGFHVGQRIVCINGTFVDPRWYRCEHQPKEGGIYTVRGFTPHEYYSDSGEDGMLWLEEIVNKPVMWNSGLWELAWPSNRFSPIIERKTDISIFTAMLNSSRQPAKV